MTQPEVPDIKFLAKEKAYQHIKNIRKTFFAPGHPMTKTTHRALKIISDDLYSKKTHCVMELIQNAEDNSYSENIQPAISFRLLDKDITNSGGQGCLIVENNETGLREENVEALCTVGDSTKTKEAGYIGEKGIGFKSVFKVSQQPHLFSNGYQFYFDANPDAIIQIGFIVPNWVEQFPNEITLPEDITYIILPLKPNSAAEIQTGLKNIQPELLLFLTKLTSLSIKLSDKALIEVSRSGDFPNISLFKNGKQYKFWLHKKTFKVSQETAPENRKNVAMRDVTIALPLTDKIEQFEHRVFAYLPTEEVSGLPFLINADFMLASAREAIQVDISWNIWLGEKVAETFVEGFCKLIDGASEHKHIAYKFIPLENNVPDKNKFFKNIAKTICNELKNREVVWTLGYNNPVKPEISRLANTEFRELVNQNELPTQLQKTQLILENLEKEFENQLKAIGVQPLSQNEILRCFADNNWYENRDINWHKKFYNYLYKYFRTNLSYTSMSATNTNLQNHKLLLLEDGRHISKKEQQIYLRSKSFNDSLLKDKQSIEKIVQKVAFLHPEIVDWLEHQPTIKTWFKDQFNIKEFDLAAYCIELAQQTPAEEKANYIEITRCIRDIAIDNNFNKEFWEKLRQELKFWCYNNSAGVTIRVTPSELDPDTGWQLIFADEQDRAHLQVISGDYLTDCATHPENRSRWKTFFANLNITDAPSLAPIEILRTTLNKATKWEKEKFDQKPPNDILGDYKLVNYRPPTWLRDLEQGNSDVEPELVIKRAKAMLRWLVKQVPKNKPQEPDSFFAKNGYPSVSYFINITSEFKDCLLNTAWLPTTKGFKKPGECFLKTQEIHDIFKDNIPYIEYTSECTPEIATLLGIIQKPDVISVVNYLAQLSKRLLDVSEVQVIRKIYEFLSFYTIEQNIVDRFYNELLIYIPASKPFWVSATTTIWPDKTNIFDDNYIYLDKYYSDLKKFFISTLKISEKVEPKLYVDVWKKLMRSPVKDVKKVESVLAEIYQELAKSSAGDSWWKLFDAEKPLIWSKTQQFVPTENIYLADDGELEAIFAHPAIHFVWIPSRGLNTYKSFFKYFSIRLLTECVKSNILTNLAKTSPNTSPRLTNSKKEIICNYLFNTLTPKVYNSMKENGLLKALLELKEFTTPKLEVTYTLNGINIHHKTTAYWHNTNQKHDNNISDNILYLQEGELELERDISSILAYKLVDSSKSDALENFIMSSLLTPSEQDEKFLQNLIRKKNWSLPEEIEQKWISSILGPNVYVEKTEIITQDQSSEKLALYKTPAQNDNRGEENIQKVDSNLPSPLGVFSDDKTTNIETPTNVTLGLYQPEKSRESGIPPLLNEQEINRDKLNQNKISQPGISNQEEITSTETSYSGDFTSIMPSESEEVEFSQLISKHYESSEKVHTADTTDLISSESDTIAAGNNFEQPEQTEWKRKSKTSNKRVKKQKEKPKTQSNLRSKLRSYVYSNMHKTNDFEDFEDEELAALNAEKRQLREKIDSAGISLAVAYEKSQGRHPKIEPHNNKGWDISSYIIDINGTEVLNRKIEVKSTRHFWDDYGVGMSAAQIAEANKNSNGFFFYVVERALDNAILYVFQNPVKLITDYRFDGNWKRSAQEIIHRSTIKNR